MRNGKVHYCIEPSRTIFITHLPLASHLFFKSLHDINTEFCIHFGAAYHKLQIHDPLWTNEHDSITLLRGIYSFVFFFVVFFSPWWGLFDPVWSLDLRFHIIYVNSLFINHTWSPTLENLGQHLLRVTIFPWPDTVLILFVYWQTSTKLADAADG